MILTAGDLELLRGDLSATLEAGACSIVATGTRTYNDSGGWSDTLAAGVTVDCRIAPVSQSDVVRHGQIATDADAVITLPHDADVDENDTIVHDGTSYSVTKPVGRTQDWLLRVFVRRL